MNTLLCVISVDVINIFLKEKELFNNYNISYISSIHHLSCMFVLLKRKDKSFAGDPIKVYKKMPSVMKTTTIKKPI